MNRGLATLSPSLWRNHERWTSTVLAESVRCHTSRSNSRRLTIRPWFTTRWDRRSNSNRVSSTGTPSTSTVRRAGSMVIPPQRSTSGTRFSAGAPDLRRTARSRASSCSGE